MDERRRAGRSGLHEPEARRAVDRAASARDAELAVHRYRLRLDRVPRDEELLADLAERELCCEERKQPQLCGRERSPRFTAVRHRLDLLLERISLVDER